MMIKFACQAGVATAGIQLECKLEDGAIAMADPGAVFAQLKQRRPQDTGAKFTRFARSLALVIEVTAQSLFAPQLGRNRLHDLEHLLALAVFDLRQQ